MDTTCGPPAGGEDSVDLELFPLRVRTETYQRSCHQQVSWSWSTLNESACEHASECPPEPVEAKIADSAFASGGWKNISLGECSMLVAPSMPSGDGGPTTPSASVKMLISGGVMYLEIADDVFVTRGSLVDTLRLSQDDLLRKPGGPRND